MNLISCLNPKLIRDNDGNQRYVPCGHCSLCLKRRASRWVVRLDSERKCWKYSIFFTLTYSAEYCPVLTDCGSHFIDVSNKHVPKGSEAVCISKDSLRDLYTYSKLRYASMMSWVKRNDGKVQYLSRYDLRCFIKRFRTYSKRLYNKLDFKLQDESKSLYFRYFAIGELGETLLRPHFHGIIYTNSEFLVNRFGQLLGMCWKYGITDWSLVAQSNSRYVSAYLNCFDNLPLIYESPAIRPFSICSKFPPIGTLLFSSNFIKNLFFSASPTMPVLDSKKNAFDNVPLWQCLTNRLYPKLTLFDKLSHSERVKLYSIADSTKVANCKSFINWCYADTIFKCSFIKDYINYIHVNCNNVPVALSRWYYISRHTIEQARVFDISVSDYVCNIERFYNNINALKLNEQYKEHERLITDNSLSLEQIFVSDKLYLDSIIDLPLYDAVEDDILLLESYGIDLEKFFSPDDAVRTSYREHLRSLLGDLTKQFKIDADDFLSKKFRTKFKNDYLLTDDSLRQKLYYEDMSLVSQQNLF